MVFPKKSAKIWSVKGIFEINSSGLFSANRYATADQIASVEGDDVVLNVAGNTLAKSR